MAKKWLNSSKTAIYLSQILGTTLYFFQFAQLDLCFSQEISQGGAKLEVTHQMKLQFLIVQIDATASLIAVHLNILLQKRNAIWTETVDQLMMSTKTIVSAAKVIFLNSFLDYYVLVVDSNINIKHNINGIYWP